MSFVEHGKKDWEGTIPSLGFTYKGKNKDSVLIMLQAKIDRHIRLNS